MARFFSSQIDEDGLRVKTLVENAADELGIPQRDILTVVQDGKCPHPAITLRTLHGIDSFRVNLLVIETSSDEILTEKLKRTLRRIYR